MVVRMTTMVVEYTSLRLGHVTFFSSLLTSTKKVFSSPNFRGPQPSGPETQFGGPTLTCSLLSIFVASATAISPHSECSPLRRLPGAPIPRRQASRDSNPQPPV